MKKVWKCGCIYDNGKWDFCAWHEEIICDILDEDEGESSL